MKKPNLFIVGAARSGTTALWHHLKKNPCIFMPKELSLKEPAFFSSLKNTRFNKFERYMTIFEPADKNHRWVGEASTAYLTDSESASRIHRYTPNAKIIIILRNPAQRAYSLYNWMVQEGYEYVQTFEEALRLEKIRINKKIPNYFEPEYYHNYLYFNSGLYSRQVKRFLELFKENVHVMKFEDFTKNPDSELNNVYNFLDIKPTGCCSDGYSNESKTVYSPVLQFILRKFTKSCLSGRLNIEPLIRNKQVLKRFVFKQVKEEITTLSAVRNIDLLERLRVYYVFNKIIRQIHLNRFVPTFNTKHERDMLIRMGHRDKKPGKMNPNTYTYLMNEYKPDILKLSKLTGIDFPEWDRINNGP